MSYCWTRRNSYVAQFILKSEIMFGLTFIISYFLTLTSGEVGESISRIHANTFGVKADSLAESAVLQRVLSSSFVECCMECYLSRTCSGVAFREGECSYLNGAAAVPDFVTSDGNFEDYKIMMFCTEAGDQVNYCVGDCESCTLNSMPDCKALPDHGYTSDGVYGVSPIPSPVYCDMSGGGWTVIQRRVDDSVDFYRGWANYVSGFGDLSANFWSGLDNIHKLTTGSATELHVYMDTFEGESAWAHYSSFSVGDATSGYLMTVSGYSGTAGDSLAFNNNIAFTTYDNDQDSDGSRNCAETFKGGWWYTTCHHANPNGLYLHGPASIHAEGVVWLAFKGYGYSLKTMELKVRK